MVAGGGTDRVVEVACDEEEGSWLLLVVVGKLGVEGVGAGLNGKDDVAC